MHNISKILPLSKPENKKDWKERANKAEADNVSAKLVYNGLLTRAREIEKRMMLFEGRNAELKVEKSTLENQNVLLGRQVSELDIKFKQNQESYALLKRKKLELEGRLQQTEVQVSKEETDLG